MPEAWYICPYDVFKHATRGRVERWPAVMKRYIPVGTGGENEFEAAEILNGYALVWVSATVAVMALIDVDPDFQIIPTPTVTVPKDQGDIGDLMLNLGYTQGEVDGTGWVSNAIFDTLTVAMNRYRARPGSNNEEVEIDPRYPGRQPPRKLAAHMRGRS